MHESQVAAVPAIAPGGRRRRAVVALPGHASAEDIPGVGRAVATLTDAAPVRAIPVPVALALLGDPGWPGYSPAAATSGSATAPRRQLPAQPRHRPGHLADRHQSERNAL